MENQLSNSKKDLRSFLDTPIIKKRLAEALGKNPATFATSIVQIVQSNDLLSKAEPSSIVGSAMTAATLNLPLNNTIGHAYIVPFNTKNSDGSKSVKAQFIIGYKGLKQLAIRSGQFKNLYAKPVYEGQIQEDESFLGFSFDWKNKKSEKVIGYASYFKLINGFESTYYMSREDVEKHAKKYSQTYKKGFGNWKDDFESMALKTVSKLHLNNGEAPLSLEMQNAIQSDQAVLDYDEEGNTIDTTYEDHPDTKPPKVDPNYERQKILVDDIKNMDDLELAEAHVDAPELIPTLAAIRKKMEKEQKKK